MVLTKPSDAAVVPAATALMNGRRSAGLKKR
jgi:hypothetical protein